MGRADPPGKPGTDLSGERARCDTPPPSVTHRTWPVLTAPVSFGMFTIPLAGRALALIAVLAAVPAAAQVPVDVPAEARATEAPSADSLVVSLLTMLPGHKVYSLFGHSAIRIRDDARGLDRAYNFGTFDFSQPFFLVRFLRGQLDYILDTAPFEAELAHYQALGRPIIEQRLDLSPAAARALYEQLEVTARPENRAYRYDFFFNNCSTRLLDGIDQATSAAGDGAVRLAPAGAHPTFRQMLQPYTRGTPTLAMGMDLGIGLPSDRRATGREQAFLPVGLADALDRASVGGRALVASRDTLFWVPGAGEVPDRTEPVVPLSLLLLGLAWAAAALRPDRFARAARIADAVLFGVAGVAGVLVAFLWFGTDHTVTGPNLNLLWAFPAHIGLAVVTGRGRVPATWQVYAAVSAVSALLVPILHVAGVQGFPTGALLLSVAVGVRAARIALGRRAARVPDGVS